MQVAGIRSLFNFLLNICNKKERYSDVCVCVCVCVCVRVCVCVCVCLFRTSIWYIPIKIHTAPVYMSKLLLYMKHTLAMAIIFQYTLRYTLQLVRCCASYILLNRLGLGINLEFLYASNTRARYILLSRLGLGINFIQRIPLRSYNDTQFVAVALFVVTPVQVCFSSNYALIGSCCHVITLSLSIFNWIYW